MEEIYILFNRATHGQFNNYYFYREPHEQEEENFTTEFWYENLKTP